jgi:hypothetical protein
VVQNLDLLYLAFIYLFIYLFKIDGQMRQILSFFQVLTFYDFMILIFSFGVFKFMKRFLIGESY